MYEVCRKKHVYPFMKGEQTGAYHPHHVKRKTTLLLCVGRVQSHYHEEKKNDEIQFFIKTHTRVAPTHGNFKIIFINISFPPSLISNVKAFLLNYTKQRIYNLEQ